MMAELVLLEKSSMPGLMRPARKGWLTGASCRGSCISVSNWKEFLNGMTNEIQEIDIGGLEKRGQKLIR